MAENADTTCRAIADYISRKLTVAIRFIDGISWEEREALFDSGDIHVCWICGLPYVWKSDADCPAIQLIAAPVMRHERYCNSPIYFSDVVVHRDSDIASFADLRGASWTYNERRSHSGYNVVRHHLSMLGETAGYFGKVIESGAHQASLKLIVDRQIDASAIDSTVLEAELRRAPELASEIRIIETLGPSPMPPWVVLKSVPAQLRSAINQALLGMHNDSSGREILDTWGISHFTTVEDAHYDSIRQMASEAQSVRLLA
ncbi:MAG: hypothetical protein JWN94_809 [Betaproteobacteria bacterium]|nr:hypothetical protein [Betaproteobacteria bacterium]